MTEPETLQAAPGARGEVTFARSPADDDPLRLVGSILDGRYLIERVVGSGGFGVVYRALHLRFDSPVAIKVLRIARQLSAEERQRFIELFLAEGKLLFTLGALHPSIVRVLEMGTVLGADSSPTPYLAMEWLEGVTLENEIRRRIESGPPRFEIAEILTLLAPCVAGLALAHQSGIAHRDIKPGNILLVDRNGASTAKLVDFGLAKAVDDTISTWGDNPDGQASDCSFTPAYAAPEQWRKSLGGTGTWTDVYALALVCVELLSGRRALSGGDYAQLMAACLDEARRPTPRAFGVAVSDDVEAVFQRALAIEPRNRYRDVRGFWQALERVGVTGRAPLAFDIVERAPRSGRTHRSLPRAGRDVAVAALVGVQTLLVVPTRAGEWTNDLGGAHDTAVAAVVADVAAPAIAEPPLAHVPSAPATPARDRRRGVTGGASMHATRSIAPIAEVATLAVEELRSPAAAEDTFDEESLLSHDALARRK